MQRSCRSNSFLLLLLPVAVLLCNPLACAALPWGQGPLDQKMQATAQRSLRFWHHKRVTVDDIQTNLRDNPRLVLAAIIDNRLYLDAASPGSTVEPHKLMWTYAQLAEALSWLAQRGASVPNSVFTFSVGHTPKHHWSAAPSFSLCNAEGFVEVPMPNMYFQTPSNWSYFHRSLLSLAAATPFTERKAVAFYRGMCRGYPGSVPRVELGAMKHPLLDVGFFQLCKRQHWAKAPTEYRLMSQRLKRMPPMKFSNFTQYQYQIHMPGATNATYSRTLQFTLGMGSVVLKWDNPYYEFYYEWLEEGKHYLTVNATNIVDTVQSLNHDPEGTAEMAAATTAWFREHLHPDFLQQYWFHLLSEYASMQDFEPSLDLLQAPCACSYAYADWNGTQCPKICQLPLYRYRVGIEV